jgi:HEAT repeat protein
MGSSMMATVGVFVLLMSQAEIHGELAATVVDAPTAEVANAPDDPALALYKAGYSAVLAKKWDESRKKFELLLKKFPRSKYADDASYWRAYSSARKDPDKGAEYYRQFLDAYPESPYIGDAVADLERLGHAEAIPGAPVVVAGYDLAAVQYEKQMQMQAEQERLQAQMENMAGQMEMKAGLMQERQRALEDMAERLAEGSAAIAVGSPEVTARRDPRRDPELEIKIAAIQALSRNREDTRSFETLKSVALDSSADWEVRAAAIQGMHEFKDRDLTALYQALLTDRNAELRQLTIMALARGGKKDDPKLQSLLVKIAEDSRESKDTRMASLVALSELKYDGLMTALEKIVTSDTDRKMRQEALVLVSRVGQSDTARTLRILKSLVSNATEDRETRETALYALAQLRGRQAFDCLKSIATSESDRKLRLTALYALAKMRSESPDEVEAVMKDVAKRTSEDRETRLAALYALSDARSDAPIDLYKDLALQEKDEEIRKVAVHLLAKSVGDKTVAFNTLSGIYGKSSGSDRQLKEAALYGIAEIGNAQSVGFLKNVAKSDPDQEMRRQAVYFLGSIGGDEAKTALIELLRKK